MNVLAALYRPHDTFSAVEASPKTSYDSPRRGAKSFQLGRFRRDANVCAATNRPVCVIVERGPAATFGPAS